LTIGTTTAAGKVANERPLEAVIACGRFGSIAASVPRKGPRPTYRRVSLSRRAAVTTGSAHGARKPQAFARVLARH
jgi:hypothetical protein